MGTDEREVDEDRGADAEPPWLEAMRRKSGLALTADGQWTWGGHVAENTRVQALFHRGVAVRDDGEVTLHVGKMWTYVKCLGPAYFLRAVRIEGGQGDRVLGRFLGDRELALAGAVAGWGPDDRLYLWVDGLPGPAIALREAHQTLLDGVQEGPDGELAIVFPRSAGAADPTEGEARALASASGAADDRAIPLKMLATIPGPRAPRPGIAGPTREMILGA